MHVHNDVLFICGSFTQREGNTSFRSTRYNGSTFTDNTGTFGGSGLRKMVSYQNTVWAAGGQGIYIWNGSSWDNSPSNGVGSIMSRQDTIYTGNDLGVVVRRISGGGTFTYPVLEGFNESVRALAFYHGELIVGGAFDSSGTTILDGTARWDGSKWQPLGAGLANGAVLSMTVYNNELIVAGSFTTIGGQAIKNIAKWNGSAWSAVGGSNTGGGANGIRDMYVHQNELYVCGDFTQLGGVPARFVAKWNGSQWIPLDLNESSDFAECIMIYKDQLYVGTFDFADAVLYRRGLTTAVHDVTEEDAIQLYPNPATDEVIIKSSSLKECTVRIYDLDGRVVYTTKQSGGSSLRISTLDWKAGIYVVKMRSVDKEVSGRFVIVR